MADRALQGVSILIIDDHEDTRDAVAASLQAEGARTMTAGSAQVGLLMLEQELPDIVVADLEMPDVDGWEFLVRVRALPPERGGRTPAVALTIHNTPEDRLRSLRAGFSLHIAKPLDIRRMADLLAAILDAGERPRKPPRPK